MKHRPQNVLLSECLCLPQRWDFLVKCSLQRKLVTFSGFSYIEPYLVASQGSHYSLNLGHTHLSRLPCWDFNPMAGRLLLNGGQKLGLGWLLQLRWRRRHNLAQLPPVSPSHQVTCHLRGRQVASQSHMLGWDWQTEMVSNSLWFLLEFVNSPQTFNKV